MFVSCNIENTCKGHLHANICKWHTSSSNLCGTTGNWVLNFWRGLQSKTQRGYSCPHHTIYKSQCPDHPRELTTDLAHFHNAAGQTWHRHNKHCTQYRHRLRSEGRGNRIHNSSLGREAESVSLKYLAAKPFTSGVIRPSAAPPSIQKRCPGWTWQCNLAQNIRWKGREKRELQHQRVL